jgi:DNA-binding MarR family transcriptional regulator
MDEFRDLEITPVQYVALVAVRDRPGLEQRALADLIAIDRSSAGRVFQFLEERGWIERVTPKENRRTKQLCVTAAGENLSDKCAPLIRRAEQRILRMLPTDDQRQFMSLLVKLVDVNNTLSRAPLKIRPSKQGSAAIPSAKDGSSGAKRGRSKGRVL